MKSRRRKNCPFNKNVYYVIRKNPLKIIRQIYRDLRSCYHRIKYGWCESDVWDMDSWFLSVVPDMLDYMREIAHGHPINITEEEWDQVLEKMSRLLRDADESESDLDLKKFDQQTKYMDKCKTEALELFNQWFWDLWD